MSGAKKCDPYKYSLRGLWGNIKFTNIEVSEEEERTCLIENLLEGIIRKKFPKLGKKINIHTQEMLKVSKKMDPNRPTPKHIIIKLVLVKDKQRTLTAPKEVSYLQWSSQKTVSYNSTEALQARRN